MPRPNVRLARLRSVGPGGSPIRPRASLTESKILDSLFRILNRTALCSLATVAPNGTAHSCHVYFAFSPELHLYFLSDPDSGHCRHVSANPTMAVSVYDSTQRWGGSDSGVALYGTCRELGAQSEAVAARAYGRRFKAYAKWRAEVKPDDMAMSWRWYRFIASRVKVFDEAAFGPAVFVVGSVRRLAFRGRSPAP